jgi:TRAP-type C4-dicarboxylate transport system permease small subunit
MKIIRATEAFLGKLESGAIVVLLTIMIVMAFLQVVLRDFFKTGILWGDIFNRNLVLWVGFLGAALATKEHRHFSIDIITKRLSPLGQRITGTIVNLFGAIVCFFLMQAAITFLRDEIQADTTVFTVGQKEIPFWCFELIIPIGFGLIMIHFILKALESIFMSAPEAQI